MINDEVGSVPLTLKNSEGVSVSVMLAPDAAEALGLQLVAQAGASRRCDPRPLQEQKEMLVVHNPDTAIILGNCLDGQSGIAVVFKPNGMRPTWIWYGKSQAVELAHAILTLSVETPKQSN